MGIFFSIGRVGIQSSRVVLGLRSSSGIFLGSHLRSPSDSSVRVLESSGKSNLGPSRLLFVHLPGKWRDRTLWSGCGSILHNYECSVSYLPLSIYREIFSQHVGLR